VGIGKFKRPFSPSRTLSTGHWAVNRSRSPLALCVVARHQANVTRYTTSTFLRAKLGDALTRSEVAPHIYESADEARARLKSGGMGRT